MLPHIDAQERFQSSGGLQRILVWTSGNINSACLWIVGQPSPTGTLHGHGGGAHLRLHGLEATEAFVDGGFQHSTRLDALRVGTEVLPEQTVVDVTAAVELERSLQSDGGADVAGRHGGVDLFDRGIEVADVGVVVLRVMDRHGLGRDGGFQGVVVVGQVGQDGLVADAAGHGGQQGGGGLREAGGEFGGSQVDGGAQGGVEDQFSGGHGGC
mmetsp:Transcript_18970/g.52690  ORF Transcript_18970/g.52690 Transcript_18970/m.52690 type:complete len:212 (+) Transcript_18970:760-1395(+)